MKKLGILFLFVSLALLGSVGIAELTGLNIKMASLIGFVAGVLVYLMLDLRPESKPDDATIVRLTRGSWEKKAR